MDTPGESLDHELDVEITLRRHIKTVLLLLSASGIPLVQQDMCVAWLRQVKDTACNQVLDRDFLFRKLYRELDAFRRWVIEQTPTEKLRAADKLTLHLPPSHDEDTEKVRVVG